MIEILAPDRLSPVVLEGVSRLFRVHHLSSASDPAALLADVGPRVRSLVRGGHASIDRALIERLPARAYLAYRPVNGNAQFLSPEIEKPHVAFTGGVLQGLKEQRATPERASDFAASDTFNRHSAPVCARTAIATSVAVGMPHPCPPPTSILRRVSCRTRMLPRV